MHALPQRQILRAMERGYAAEALEQGCQLMFQALSSFYAPKELGTASFELNEWMSQFDRPIRAEFYRDRQPFHWQVSFGFVVDESIRLYAEDENGGEDLVFKTNMGNKAFYRSFFH